MTGQASDSLRFDDQEWFVRAEPLGPHVADLGVRFIAPHTGLWRGYLASWEVTPDQKLVLAELVAWVPDDARRPVERQLTELGGRPLPHHADYVSGSIPIGRGELVRYVHMGHESRNETELVLHVVDGHVVAVRPRGDRPPAPQPPIDPRNLTTTPAPDVPLSDGSNGCPVCAAPFAEEGEIPSMWCPHCGVRIHMRCMSSHQC